MYRRDTDESLLDVLQRHVRERGHHVAYAFLSGDGTRSTELTYAALDSAARFAAAALAQRGTAGQPVLILCPEGPDYVVALLGCLYAGAIAVPAYPPKVGLARAWERVRTVAEDAGVRIALTTRELVERWNLQHDRPLGAIEPLALSWMNTVEPSTEIARASAEQPAILQYTSGSTSEPKGVVLTHGQVLANQQMGCASGSMSSDDVFLSWLPPFHDMGLMGGILQSLYVGGRAVLMPPEAFVRRARRWLAAAQEHRATVLMAPNFAFHSCVRRIKPADRAGLDLSSVRVVYNGAEPINPDTLDAFTEAFAPYGFRREAFYPCYGMAEATLIISGGDPTATPVVRAYAAEDLEQGRASRVTPESGSRTKNRRLVGCGRALLDERIMIVDPHTQYTLDPRQVGEIWVQSRSVALGYWKRDQETEKTFGAHTADTKEGPFLRTGDLGFFDDGELFITGRLKDLIILRGLNHYPQDIERTLQGVSEALVADAGAAFSIDGDGGEQLVVVQELDKRLGADSEALLRLISQAIRDVHDIAPAAIVLIKRGSMRKTSSGKVQRRATKQAYLDGSLHVVASWQALAASALDDEQDDDSRDAKATSAPIPQPDVAHGSSHPEASLTQTRPVAHRREQMIADWLREHLAGKVGRKADDIDPREPLARYGVDSLVAAELTEELERWLGIELPSTVSYDNPTIADLARALASLAREPNAKPPRARPDRGAHSSADTKEPIAIVGMACRLPGVSDLDGFWQLLRHGVDAITEIPADRWDVNALYDPGSCAPGKMCSKWGGFVAGIDQFDAAFFGISAREAARMDPQQRMFLEVAWEALEDAGQSPVALGGSRTGVFAGVCSSDYATLYGGDLRLVDADYGTGNAPSIVANRLSYFLDLKGPSETVDSACSSSLVALQHACRSLRNLECDLAIVGGVNAVLAPESNVYFSQARALAKDGRCKTFDSRADGFVRSEGAGVVVLKPLSRALADGDRIYALVAGGAVNHDGRSNGLMAPNGLAQQELVRRALTTAGIGADELDYVEAHGVGTPVADAVELRALGAVLEGRSESKPLLVGSVKTNVGHLEAASGMVSLIKVALALQHEEIPPHLHLRDVHPDIGIEALPIVIPTIAEPWRRGGRPRFAGISTFGFGGTNAHVVLREAPVIAQKTRELQRPRHLLALSAKDPGALRQLATRVTHRLKSASDEKLGDICFSANAGRGHFTHRLAVTGTSVGEIREQLEQFGRGVSDPRVRASELKPGARLLLAFVFAETTVAPDTGRALFDTHPQFRQTLQLCDRILRPHLENALLEVLYGMSPEASAALLSLPSYGHAALLALQYALHALWRVWGLEPTAVYGAGASEYAAAAASGVLAWEQAVVLTARRGLVLEGLSQGASRSVTVRQLKDELAAVHYLAPSVPFVSASLDRAFALGEVPDQAHFGRHIYHAPKPEDAREPLRAESCDAYLELGTASAFAAHERVASETWLSSLGTTRDDWQTLLSTLTVLYTRGAEIDWRTFDAPYARRKVSLPTYPFQRQRHWLDFPDRNLEPAAPVVIERASSHPLISRVRIHPPARSGFVRNTVDESGEGSSGQGGGA